ncbi:hypothetical protein JX265_001171 [Neoarthrinium moseri]|uniref:Uncharacterized protein n=1 Tax=Neoarthrinium moseri TaxID=1658444 RepID=A0A9Q0AVM6_9PEZI|nr:uncharacterized protein JN550_007345 [Neoarthrinium moseri]KAI1848841.1 hypothetical protein JX266_005269 [Neoarthrinium moseri]KAI1866798.1 hypothetical protein JN550_007345 [Neoarthrinium moseri]KAI1880931.1 hypothetical protein JX265_001171 [Neoarthrinium moseri]
MGHKSKFTFPVPGWRSKQPTTAAPPPPTASAPMTKAQKILGTGGINIDSPATSKGDGLKLPWDSRSGISISISESSASYTTRDTGLGILDEEDDGTQGTSYGRGGWDAESEIIPRHHLGVGKGLRAQRSAATIGNDYRTDASSVQRRQSNASSFAGHYDRSKVPLSVSQQTSASAMAKGYTSKAHSLLDMDGSIAGPMGKKKKPARLDLSLLKPRSRKEQHSQPAPVLGNNYVMRSPSFVSQMSPALPSADSDTPRKLTKVQSAGTTHSSPRGPKDMTTLSQLYEHYEQMSFRGEHSPDQEYSSHFDTVVEEPEPTPPLTTASTLTPVVTPLSNPVIREPNRHRAHFRKDSSGSRNTVVSGRSSNSLAYHVSPRQDCASSISSRNTRTSKTSRTMDSDLQQNSVLSLSDSDSDDATFSDSAPKSSVSSHTNMSYEDISSTKDTRKGALGKPPVIQERGSSKSRQAAFTPLNDYLAIPTPGSRTHNARVPSSSTSRSQSSSTSTATATGNSLSGSTRGSRLSVSTTGTSESTHSSRSGSKKHHKQDNGLQEAKAVTFAPMASTAEALHSLSEMVAQETERHRLTQGSDQLTPPLSPSSVDFYMGSPERKNNVSDAERDAHNARLMAVTKQEEMLLAALRQKRARMRENILAEIESEKSTTMSGSRKNSASSSTRGSQKSARKTSVSSSAPQLPPYQPRTSSLVTSFRNLTEGSEAISGRKNENNVRFADEPATSGRSDPVEKRSSSALSNATIKATPASGRHERVLMFLDRPLNDIDFIDAAEPSPDLSEFMDFDQDSDGEIVPERRRSRRRSKYMSIYGSSQPAVGKRGSDRPRVDSNLFGPRGTPLRSQLENLPETNMEEDIEIDFDGFSDVMSVARTEKSAGERTREQGVARPDSPVSGGLLKGHIRGKSSAVRLSAVGHAGLVLPPEAGVWGDDG